MPQNTLRDAIGDASVFLEAMGNQHRLIILDILTRGEISVGALGAVVGLGQSALSQHLGRLRAANLVNTRRVAQTIYYSCDREAVARVLALLEEFFGGNYR